jgi:hypothetical protein
MPQHRAVGSSETGVLSSDLRAILRIKARAEAAITGSEGRMAPSQAEEVIHAYERLRSEA